MHSRTRLSRPRLFLFSAIAALLALLVAAGGAGAKGSARFQPGHLPAIGQIELTKVQNGRVEISVPVTYTKATSESRPELESSLVSLKIAAKLKRGRPVGQAFSRTYSRRLKDSGTVVERFLLGPEKSRWLLGKSRRLRGELVRVDVQHLIKERRGERALHQKDASQTMASSHRAKAQGASIELTLRNDTNGPVNNVATPIMCMYTDGEEGSNLEWFSTNGSAMLPGETIEAEIEADASIFDEAEYQGPTGESAGQYFDYLGFAADAIAYAFDVELTPFTLGLDLVSHCDAMASTFSFVAATRQGGGASTSEAWVLTDETCRIGCPNSHFISDYYALGFQGLGEETNPGLWNHKSTELLEAFVGSYYGVSSGRIVQDDGLHFDWSETGDEQWEVSIGEGSSPAGFSG